MPSIENKIVLLALSLAMFVLVIDTTIMNVSITAVVNDLSCDVTEVQAAITLYALVMATLMITCGKIGDIWGRKVTFKRGLVVYGIGSLITALSPTITVLYFGWSFLEGIEAAFVFACTTDVSKIKL
ncbi:MAG: MFS transporter [Methanotrichaceae archaeon]|nr:MFS transporter [Methanotrichaceae archaeon]